MFRKFCFVFINVLIFSVCADENVPTKTEIKEQPMVEKQVTTDHSVTIEGKIISYKATTGTIVLKDDAGKSKASIFYIAYKKEGAQDSSKRPITFCFNGGPGSSSVWLHMGVLGPRRAVFDEDGFAQPPYEIIDNEFSILDQTDLVFIDPVSTGYSRSAPGEDEKQFHGVDDDIKSIAEFIRLYVTKEGRWDSPKYLAGESYGATRAAGVAEELHDKKYIYLNGVIIISGVLNFQTLLDSTNGNDLPYILYLPTYTATAWYHEKLSPELQKDFIKTREEVQKFALTEYTLALMQGNKLDPKMRSDIVQKLSRYTALSPDYIERANLRIDPLAFSKELLRKDNRTVGRFDSRYTGIDANKNSECFEYDPSKEAVIGAFTAALNQYLQKDLKWEGFEEYKILTPISWRYNNASNQYLNLSGHLREVMTKNPSLKVFVGSGYFDLATPYFATDYTFTHLGLDPSIQNHVTMKYYDGGHMMYINYPSLVQLKKDLAEYFKKP